MGFATFNEDQLDFFAAEWPINSSCWISESFAKRMAQAGDFKSLASRTKMPPLSLEDVSPDLSKVNLVIQNI